MKRFLGMLAVVASVSAAQAGIIVSEVVDGDLAGGNPKFVEITNTGPGDYTFPGGGIILQSNDSADTVVDVNLTGVTILAGDSYVVASDANGGVAQWAVAYGAGTPDLFTPAFFGNGDDRYAVSDGTNILDIYGTFGSRAAPDLATYNYLDSYAYRLPSYTDGEGAAYDASQWFVPGPAALDAPDDATRVALLQANTTPGSHVFVPEPASIALIGLGVLVLRRR